jgi:hypothetical protein
MTDRTKQFVDDLNAKFNKNLALIDFQFNNEYGWPEFDPLRDEITKCLICDLCQASITLTNHLLEDFLKTILIYHDTISNNNKKTDLDLLVFRPSVDTYDGLDLAQTLGRAKRKGIITKKQWKLLEKFREDYRNAYSHAEKKKIFKDMTINANKVKLENNQINVSDSNETLLVDLIMGQGLVQVILSKKIAFDYFISVDNVIRDVIKRFLKKTTT